MAQVHNGDVGGHRDRTSDACFPKQERREVENGIPRELDKAQGRSRSRSRSPDLSSPEQENGFLLGRDEHGDDERDKDDGQTTPPPRKKRGRRKLERPTKCEFFLAAAARSIRCARRDPAGGGVT